jgi:hypothetical protein
MALTASPVVNPVPTVVVSEAVDPIIETRKAPPP